MIKIRNHGEPSTKIRSIKFPGGEINVDIRETGTVFTLEAHLHSSDDIMELLLATDALKRCNAKDIEINLVLPYIPYARQDRVCNYGEALSIKVFCDLINAQNYNSVTVYDPHSDVAPALLNNCIIYEQWELIDEIWDYIDMNNTVLVSPDAGALKKTYKLAKQHGFGNVVTADKSRNVATGEITGTILHGSNLDIGNKDFLIVDDICDGGRTFTELAKKLKPLTNGKIYLYVTHAILSKGLAPLMKNIDHIFTANPWCENVNEDYITILKP